MAGNKISTIGPPANPAAFKTLLTDPPDDRSSFVQRLSDGRDSNRIITQQEIDLLQNVIDEGPSSWEEIKNDGKVSAHRYKNRDLFKGCLFGQLQAHLPDCSKELVAHSVVGITEGGERGKWDKQVFDFTVFPAPGGNEIVHYKMNAPPFSIRDFACFQVLCRHREGGGSLAYMRAAADALVPASKDKVRAHVYCIATEILDDPAGGTRFKTTTVLDPAIPFLPSWVINMFIPMEFAKWISGLERHCAHLKSKDVLPASVPSAALFLPPPAAASPEAACEASKDGPNREGVASAPALSLTAAAPAADAAVEEAAPAAADPPVAAAASPTDGAVEDAVLPLVDPAPVPTAESAKDGLNLLSTASDVAHVERGSAQNASWASPVDTADEVAPKTGWLCCASK